MDMSDWKKHIANIQSAFRKLQNPPIHWTAPFIPWCGEDYIKVRPRILFVGKTVGAFRDPDSVEWLTRLPAWKATGIPDVEQLTNRYVGDRVATFQPRSPAFWLKVYLIGGALLPDTVQESRIIHSIAWSNIYKVNSVETDNGIPTNADLQCKCPGDFCLLHQSATWFREELRILKPDLVLLGVSDEWPRFASALNIAADATSERPFMLEQTAVEQLGLGYRPAGIWITNHFTAWAQRHRNKGHGGVILQMRKALRH